MSDKQDLNVLKLQQHLREILLSGDISDIILTVKDQEFKSHRCILAARSPVFSAMMKTQMKENITGVVDIEDVDPKTFSYFLDYLYTGSTEDLTSETVIKLYTAADKYQVEMLKETCLDYMLSNVTIQNFCDIFIISVQNDEKTLKETCIQYFTKHSLDIIKTCKWQSFLCENPIVGNELYIKQLQLAEMNIKTHPSEDAIKIETKNLMEENKRLKEEIQQMKQENAQLKVMTSYSKPSRLCRFYLGTHKSDSDNDEDYEPSSDDEDDEQTIIEQDKMELDVDHEKELAELQAERGLSLEELKEKYAVPDMPNESDEDEEFEDSSEEEENADIDDNDSLPSNHESQFEIQICKCATGEKITLEVERSDSIESVMALIEEEKGIPHDEQKLLYKDKELDERNKLSDYSIHNGSTIYLLLRGCLVNLCENSNK